MKVCINKDYERFSKFIEETPERFESEGTSIYKARNEIKCFEFEGITLNVKSYKVPIFINRIIYSWIRKSKARRAYEYAIKLAKKGFVTPTPIAYLELKKWGLLHKSFFISIHTPLDGNMRIFNDGDANNDGKEELIKEFALFTAKLHEADVLHCDYSPGNILWEKNVNGKYTFSLIDINRMEFKPVSVEMGSKNFARMRGNDEFFTKFATYYAQARNSDVEQCVANFLKYKKEDRAKRAKKEKFKQFKKKLFSK